MNIKTFSEKAGVSVATASRALNTQTAHMVKAQTRIRIQSLAAELNFVPNPGARVLRGTSQAPLAILLKNRESIFLSEYYARLLSGILKEASRHKLAVHVVAFTPDLSRDICEQLTAATVGCGGIVYLSDSLPAEVLVQLERLHQPFVAISNSLPQGLDLSQLGFPVFGADDLMGGKAVMDHLIAMGHRKFAFLHGPADRRDVRERMQGFEASMKEHHLLQEVPFCVHTDYAFESGIRAANDLYPRISQITAVACGSDELALGLIHGLGEKGVRCPEDISITGFDDALWASRHSPSLTTIRQPWMEMAKASVNIVRKLGQKTHTKKDRIEVSVFPSELVIRETTAAPNPHKM